MFSSKYLNFSDEEIEQLERAYPGLKIHEELLRMSVWLSANKRKAERYKNFNRFVVNWLAANHMKLLEAEVKGRAIVMQKDELAHREARAGMGPRA